MDMLSLVIGLLIGWLIELGIDWYFWRRPSSEEILAIANRKELVTTRAELTAVKEKLATAIPYQQRLQNAQATIQTLETNQIDNDENQQVKISDLENEITRLKKQVTDNRHYRQKMVAAEQEASHLTQKVTDLEEQLEKLRDTIAQLENQPTAPDNLQKIEGIGPKIAELLNQADINSFQQLATTSVDQLKAILATAGDRYHLINPETWPQQAQLAATNAWDALKTLQDQLVGGQHHSGNDS